MVDWNKVRDRAGEIAQETGEKIIGRGREVEFRHNVKEHADNYGVSEEVAQKTIFQNWLNDLRGEASANCFLDKKSEGWQRFEAAMNECFTGEEQDELKKLAGGPDYRRVALTPPDKKDVAAMKRYYEDNYDKKSPRFTELNDTVNAFQLLQKLGRRIDGNIGSNLTSPDKIADIVRAYPETGANLGKLLEARRVLMDRERVFARDVACEDAAAKWGKTCKEEFFAFGRNGKKWVDDCFKSSNFKHPISGVFKIALHTGEFLLKETVSLGKVGWHTSKALAHKLNTIRNVHEEKKTHISP